eukprot:UN24235
MIRENSLYEDVLQTLRSPKDQKKQIFDKYRQLLTVYYNFIGSVFLQTALILHYFYDSKYYTLGILLYIISCPFYVGQGFIDFYAAVTFVPETQSNIAFYRYPTVFCENMIATKKLG